MSTVILIGAVIASLFVDTCHSIECYSCISQKDPNCLNPEKYRMEKVKCDMTALGKTKEFASSMDVSFSKIFEVHLHDMVPLNCLKQVTLVKGEEVIMRGCQLPKDNRLDVCKKVKDDRGPTDPIVTFCELCETDGCNSGSRLVPAVAAIPLLLLLLLRHHQP